VKHSVALTSSSFIDFIFILNELPIIIDRQKLFGKRNWVCNTMCGQDFARKSSGNRYNSNFHSRSAKLIRHFCYAIGRLNGEIASLPYMIHCYIYDTG
jgi:hypothetical protein